MFYMIILKVKKSRVLPSLEKIEFRKNQMRGQIDPLPPAFLALINSLDKIDLPIISNCQKQTCGAIITGKEFKIEFKLKKNNKTPGNDGLSREFYKGFWDDVKTPLLTSINDVFIKE